MIANRFNSSNIQPDFDLEIGITARMIAKAFEHSCLKFINAIELIKKNNLRHELNENSLTQELVAQVNRNLRILDLPICVGREYIDIHTIDANTKRTVDFYFYSSEQDEETKSIFSVEAKRLPTPTKIREKEYVIGADFNGGIERFKIEEHGKGLLESGMIGFVESGTFDDWLITINSWLQELIETNTEWIIDEKLIKVQSTSHWAKHISMVNRGSKEKLKLFHFWIKTYKEDLKESN